MSATRMYLPFPSMSATRIHLPFPSMYATRILRSSYLAS
jgi:hypothetical protein